MYSIILVDDEAVFLKGIIKAVRWKEYGFVVKGIFENAFEVLEFLEKEHVDVIITDIRMPEMNGVELAKVVYEKYLDMLVVLLSAYSKFEYAREAIRYNIVDYLLKPVGTKEVNELLGHLGALLNRRIHAQNIIEHGISQKQFIADYIMGCIDKNRLKEYIENTRLNIDPVKSLVMLICIQIKDFNKYTEKWIYGKEKMYGSIDNLFRMFSVNFIRYKTMCDRLNYLVFSNDIEDLKTYEQNISEKIKDMYSFGRKNLDLKMNIYIERKAECLFDLKNEEDIISKLNHAIQMTMSFIIEKNYNASYDYVSSVFHMYKWHTGFLRLYTESVINRFFYYCNKMPKHINSADIYNIESTQELKEQLIDYIKNASDIVNTNKSFVDNAVDYIKENYNRDISLNDVAEHVGVVPQSLSRAFKRDMNVRFVDFLVEIRIEKAKKYLEDTELQIKEVSKMVGFSDIRYFNLIFKKNAGCSAGGYWHISRNVKKSEGSLNNEGNKK